jgi:hypothetical protein
MFAILHVLGFLGMFMIPLVLAPVFLLGTVFWIWMLIHAITNHGLSDGEKVAWVLVIFFLHFVGALIYFFIGRPKAAGAGP